MGDISYDDGATWQEIGRHEAADFQMNRVGFQVTNINNLNVGFDYFRLRPLIGESQSATAKPSVNMAQSAPALASSQPKTSSTPPPAPKPVIQNINFSDEFDSGKPDPRWKAGDNVISSDQPGWIALKGGSIKQKITSKDFTVATHIRLGRTKSSTNGVLSFSEGKKWIHCKVWELNQKPLLLHSGRSYEIKGATKSNTLHLVKDEVWLRMVCRDGVMETLGSMDGFNWLSLQKNIDIRNITNGSVGVETFNEPDDPPIMHVDYFRVNLEGPSNNVGFISDEFNGPSIDSRWIRSPNFKGSLQSDGWLFVEDGGLFVEMPSKRFVAETHLRADKLHPNSQASISYKQDEKNFIDHKICWLPDSKTAHTFFLKDGAQFWGEKQIPYGNGDLYLRLVRFDNEVTTYVSFDAQKWDKIRTIPVSEYTSPRLGIMSQGTDDPHSMVYNYFRISTVESTDNNSASSASTCSGEMIVDNSDPGFTASANWHSGNTVPDKFGRDSRHRSTEWGAGDAAVWNFNLSATRSCEIFAWWSVGSNRSWSAPYVIEHADGTTVVHKSQQENGGSWQSLGTYKFNAGPNNVKLSCWTADGFVVVADAIRIVPR